MSRAAALGVVAIARDRAGLGDAAAIGRLRASRAHYAATRSIAEGHPYIDRYANETCDLVRMNGHYYAAKAPALELWSAPFYLLLHAVGAVPRESERARSRYPDAMAGVPLRAVWQIGLWAVVLPAHRAAAADPAGRRVDRAGARNRRRGDPRARDARAAVLDAALRARACRGARVPLLLPAVSSATGSLLPSRRGRGRGPRGRDRSAARDPGGRCSASTRRRDARASAGSPRSLRAASSACCRSSRSTSGRSATRFTLAYAGDAGPGRGGGWQATGFFGQGAAELSHRSSSCC